jgi:hypothetical protein
MKLTIHRGLYHKFQLEMSLTWVIILLATQIWMWLLNCQAKTNKMGGEIMKSWVMMIESHIHLIAMWLSQDYDFRNLMLRWIHSLSLILSMIVIRIPSQSPSHLISLEMRLFQLSFTLMLVRSLSTLMMCH